MKQDAPPLLELHNISKSFGGVAALREVDFTLKRGEIHGLVGENGAGKSTLMKIIAGVHHEFDGTMRIDGSEVRFRSARDALSAGVGMVHQELSVVPDLSVAENVFLGKQPVTAAGAIDWRRMYREAKTQIASLGLDIDPRTRMGSLPVGIQQLIELSRVLFSGARIVILDEPTSALSPPEVERLFGVLRKLRDSGRSIVFISHFLDDILAISDRITIFRNGRRVVTHDVDGIDKAWVIERMIGSGHSEIGESYEADITLNSKLEAPVVLETDKLSIGRAFHDVSLKARSGEILGIYGFMGSGQIELARTLFGKLKPDSGSIAVSGLQRHFRSTASARKAGIAYVTESRRSMLFTDVPIFKNISIAILSKIHLLLVKPDEERRIAAAQAKDLQIRPPKVDLRLGALSGGNQQKVALAKWLAHAPKVLILSEPTRGMDVGAKEDVVRIVTGLREKGIAIIVLSTEPETVLSLADRIVVMKKGTIAREFANETVNKNRLLAAA